MLRLQITKGAVKGPLRIVGRLPRVRYVSSADYQGSVTFRRQITKYLSLLNK